MSEWTDEGMAWLATLKPAIREKAEAYPPPRLYRLKSTGQLCHIEAYEEGEDGSCSTCRIVAWQEWAPELTAREVFGIPFADLVSADGDDAS